MVKMLPELPSGGVTAKVTQAGKDAGNAVYGVGILAVAGLIVFAGFRYAQEKGWVPRRAQPNSASVSVDRFGTPIVG